MNLLPAGTIGARGVHVKLVDNWRAVLRAEHKSALRGLTLMTQNFRRIEKGQIKYKPYPEGKKNEKGYWEKSKRPAISLPGQPPYARLRKFKNAFRYSIDEDAMTGWAGPITFRKPKTLHVPKVLEFGGKSNGGKSNITPWVYKHAPDTIDNMAALADWVMSQKIPAGIRPTGNGGKTNRDAFSGKTNRVEKFYVFAPKNGRVTRNIAQRTAQTLADKFGYPANYTLPETIAEHPYARPALEKAKRDFPRFLAWALKKGMKAS